MTIHADDPGVGYCFIADELPNHGITAGKNRVQRLCSAQRLCSVHSKKRGLYRWPGPAVHEDLVERDVSAPAPNRPWLTDLTEHRTDECKVYLRDQGRLLQPDRGLLDRLPDEGLLSGHDLPGRGGPPRRSGRVRGP